MATITLQGNPVNTVDNLPSVGTVINDFELVGQDLSIKKLSDFSGK